jgi:hypothetical protein
MPLDFNDLTYEKTISTKLRRIDAYAQVGVILNIGIEDECSWTEICSITRNFPAAFPVKAFRLLRPPSRNVSLSGHSVPLRIEAAYRDFVGAFTLLQDGLPPPAPVKSIIW